ncbi:MAG: hypothetical protein A2085_09810 [Gemmatimonadetes bacterium GWC2_71_10]|nr:MAG: hypothetical protein A2085_09810 [Gemmatimonadetes bacterium GWC2_71_10]
MAAVRRGIIATDRLTLGFAVVMVVAVLRSAPASPSWPLHLLAFALIGPLVWLLARAPDDTPFMNFVGPVYPLLLVVMFYTALGTLNEEVGRNHDLWAQRADVALFGTPLSVTWHQRWPNAALSWILHITYVSYYPIVLTAGLWHWRRTPREAYERAAFLIALAFFVCYAVFAFFPVTGPRYFWGAATGPAAETWPARVVNRLLESGSAYGTAFPSSHIAASWTAVLATWRSSRRLALALGVPALGLALGTVYGQFHYAIDAVAGAALAVTVLLTADRLRRLLGGRAPVSAAAPPRRP